MNSMVIYFKSRDGWLDACIHLMKSGATFEAFEPDGMNAMFYITLTGGF